MNRGHNLLVAAVLWASVLASAEIGHGDEAPLQPPLKLTIHPAAAPRPALKYQLLPEFKTRIRGNAAVYYGKVTAESQGVFGDRQLLDNIDNWGEMPLAELRKGNIDMPTLGVEKKLARAARCDSCDWQLPVHEESFFEILLPEVQQTRQFAYILGTRARIQIAAGEFDDAVKTFQSGFALARNVAEGETLINQLVGIAICSIMQQQMMEFVQQPEAPNLYWALTMLPRPLVDLRKGLEAEMEGLASSFPEIRDLDAKRTPDEWRLVLNRFWQKVVDLSDDKNLKEGGADAVISQSVKEYPAAKQALIDRGLPTDVVEAMPAAQVVLVYTVKTYEDLRDDVFKWFFVPYVDGMEAMASASEEFDAGAEPSSDAPTLLAKMLLPSVKAIRRASARTDRDIGVLRVIEALRIYGAGHRGQLPQSLADITEVPVPADPVSGKPFDYGLDGDTAVLKVSPLPGRPHIYEIKMVRP
jgi:hypothetical protein